MIRSRDKHKYYGGRLPRVRMPHSLLFFCNCLQPVVVSEFQYIAPIEYPANKAKGSSRYTSVCNRPLIAGDTAMSAFFVSPRSSHRILRMETRSWLGRTAGHKRSEHCFCFGNDHVSLSLPFALLQHRSQVGPDGL